MKTANKGFFFKFIYCASISLLAMSRKEKYSVELLLLFFLFCFLMGQEYVDTRQHEFTIG